MSQTAPGQKKNRPWEDDISRSEGGCGELGKGEDESEDTSASYWRPTSQQQQQRQQQLEQQEQPPQPLPLRPPPQLTAPLPAATSPDNYREYQSAQSRPQQWNASASTSTRHDELPHSKRRRISDGDGQYTSDDVPPTEQRHHAYRPQYAHSQPYQRSRNHDSPTPPLPHQPPPQPPQTQPYSRSYSTYSPTGSNRQTSPYNRLFHGSSQDPPPPPPPPPPHVSNQQNDPWRSQLPYPPPPPPPPPPPRALYSYSSSSIPSNMTFNTTLPQPPPVPPPPPPELGGESRNIQYSPNSVYNHHSPMSNVPQTTQSIIADLESQCLRLSQENHRLRDKLQHTTAEFAPGDNLRGIVIQLFEVVEDYAEIISEQQQQVQQAMEAAEAASGIISGDRTGSRGIEIPVPRRKAVVDTDVMTEDQMVTCLRGMHTTMRSRLNTLRRIGAERVRVGLVERNASVRPDGPVEWIKERQSLLSKTAWLENERMRLMEKVEAVTRAERESALEDTSANATNLAPPKQTVNSANASPSDSQPSTPSQRYTTQLHNPNPSSPSTMTIAPSTAPSSAIYTDTLNNLQHRLSLNQLELETLQAEHTRLRAAFQRSHTRAAALQKKLDVSSEENDGLIAERDHFQMLYETMKEQLAEVTASRDEYRRQGIAGGGQYGSILAMATKLELKGVEDRKRWKAEKEGLERERAELITRIVELEKELQTRKAELEKVNASSAIIAPGVSLAESPSSSVDALEAANDELRWKVRVLEAAQAEMRREAKEILRATQRFLGATGADEGSIGDRPEGRTSSG